MPYKPLSRGERVTVKTHPGTIFKILFYSEERGTYKIHAENTSTYENFEVAIFLVKPVEKIRVTLNVQIEVDPHDWEVAYGVDDQAEIKEMIKDDCRVILVETFQNRGTPIQINEKVKR